MIACTPDAPILTFPRWGKGFWRLSVNGEENADRRFRKGILGHDWSGVAGLFWAVLTRSLGQEHRRYAQGNRNYQKSQGYHDSGRPQPENGVNLMCDPVHQDRVCRLGVVGRY